MNKEFRRARLAALCGVACFNFVSSTAALADDVNAGTQLEEIMVTAQKRSESAQKVGLGISVLSSEDLEQRQIFSIQGLAAAIPSMSYADTPTGTPVITLRGVGFYDTSLSATPAVSLYMNQIPLAYPVMASHGIFDLQRVEVLKGPQGILFGENSTGGAINYIPISPTKKLSAGITLGFGSYNRFTEEAYVSGPVSDTLSVRLANRVEMADGWQRSVTRPGDTSGQTKLYEGRIIVDFTPSDKAKFEFNFNGWVDHGQPQSPQLIGFALQHPGHADPAVFALPLAPADNKAADWYPGLPKKHNSFYQASLRGEFQILENITLTSLTAFSKFKQNESATFDGTPYLEEVYDPQIGKVTSFFQELRLNNDQSSSFRWMVGGNYQYDKIYQEDYYEWFASSSAHNIASFGFPGGSDIFSTDQTTKTLAGFVNGEYDISDQFTFKAGARYTSQDLTSDDCVYDVIAPYYVGQLFYGPGNYKPGACFAYNDIGRTLGGVAPGTPGRYKDSVNEHNVSWRVGLDWKPNSNTLLYANVAKGYKTGGFPAVSASVWSQQTPLKQESVLDYEVGTKLTLLDRKLQVNAAAFYYDYSQKQLRARNIDPFWGNLDIVQNIPKSKSKGIEIDATARPIAGLTLTAGGSYINATIDEYTGVNTAGVVADFSGTPMPYTPKWNANLNAEYRFPVTADITGYVGATLTYHSSTTSIVGGAQNPPQAIPNTFPLYSIDSNTLVDVRAGIEWNNWHVDLYGKNIFNKYYWNTAYAAFDTVTRYTGMPMTLGGTVGYKF